MPRDVQRFCLRCRYRLIEPRGRCPECGLSYDGSPGSYAVERRFEWPKWFLRPPGVLEFGAGLWWLGIWPAFYYMFIWLLFMVLVPMTVFLVAVRFGPAWAYPRLRSRLHPEAWRRDALLLGLVVVIYVGLWSAVPMRLAFLLAMPALEHQGTALGSNLQPTLATDIQAGLYRISASNTQWHYHGFEPWQENDVVFVFADDPEAGFIYSPDGIADLKYNNGSKGHLIGNWYWMKQD